MALLCLTRSIFLADLYSKCLQLYLIASCKIILCFASLCVLDSQCGYMKKVFFLKLNISPLALVKSVIQWVFKIIMIQTGNLVLSGGSFSIVRIFQHLGPMTLRHQSPLLEQSSTNFLLNLGQGLQVSQSLSQFCQTFLTKDQLREHLNPQEVHFSVFWGQNSC